MVDEVPSADDIFDPVLVWVNGGGSEQHLRDLPNNIAKQLLRLIEDVPHDQRAEIQERAQDLSFNEMIDQMVAWGNDVEKTRQAFGASKGRIGQIKGPNQLDTIWRLIGPALGGITCDQFYGFDPIDKQGYDSWPTYLGIVGCCAVLDIIGFQAEKKTRKLAKMPGVRSDAQHIAMGAFCSAILTADKRLARRAKAIYEYKRIGTVSLMFERSTDGSPRGGSNT